MKNETRQRLLDAYDSCQAIARYTVGLDIDTYAREEMVRDAVERRLAIIGEALNRVANLEPALSEQIPQLRQVVGLRIRVIHGYDDLDNDIVWDVAHNKIPILEARIAELIGEDTERLS
jgi:uncharacterized protein with HEPN domain